MTKEEMEIGLAMGRTLIQEEWADKNEIEFVDELIAKGKVKSTPWEYKDNFQCERRRITARAKLR
jgi:hypothetical protein